jgi:hypothetical protein
MKTTYLKLIIIIPSIIAALFIAHEYRNESARSALRTNETPLTVVKTEDGCVMCGTTVGFLSQIVTYSYVIDGRTFEYVDERENSRRSPAGDFYSKVCYETNHPDNFSLIGAGYQCPR